MASLQSGGGGRSGRKALDQEVPLVPFIDLLLCCVMFLLVTAVWNQIAAMKTHAPGPGVVNEESPAPRRIVLGISANGFILGSTDGEELQIPKLGERFDLEELRTRLAGLVALDPENHHLVIRPDDGVLYADVVATMDVATASELTDVEVSPFARP